MHDLDGGNLELAGETFGGFAPGTLSSHPAGPPAAPGGGGLSEMQELELASELLAVRDEAELEQFINRNFAGYGFGGGIGGQRHGHAHRRRLRGIVGHPIQRFYRQHRQPRYQRYHPGLLVPMGTDDGPGPADLAPDAPPPVIAAPIETPIVAPVEQPEMELADACRAVRLATAAARRASALPPSPPSAPAFAGSPFAPPPHGFAGAGGTSAYPTASAAGYYPAASAASGNSAHPAASAAGTSHPAASATGASATHPAPSAIGAGSTHPAASPSPSSAAGARAERGTWTRRGHHIVLSGA